MAGMVPTLPATACRFCGAALDALALRRKVTVCGSAACRQRDDAQRGAALQATLASAALQAARLQHPAAAAPAAVVWLCHAPGELEPVSADDRDSHQAHLLAAVRDNTHIDHPSLGGWTSNNTQTPQGGQLCRQCGGGCCVHGLPGHAFIDHTLLQRWVAARPGSSVDDAVASYMGLLPDRHVSRSCLYQGDSGCVLPRADRADICNGYACDALRAVQQLAAQDPAASAVAVTLQRSTVRHSVLLTADGVQPLALDMP